MQSPRALFASLKAEWIGRHDYQTHAAAVASIADYIDAFYNHLDYVSPIEFEMRAQRAAVAA
jgi:transposase InsO family protein